MMLAGSPRRSDRATNQHGRLELGEGRELALDDVVAAHARCRDVGEADVAIDALRDELALATT